MSLLMNARRLVAMAAFAWALAGCGPQSTPTLFIPPTMAAQPLPPAAGQPDAATSPTPGSIIVPTVVLPSPTPPCTNDLAYVQDLTIPDGSHMTPGQSIDKQWEVLNSGSCNWDQRYRLKLINGDSMGAAPLLPLYPARAGTQATLRILFTAPQAPGIYECQWQAVDPDGQAFGDAFYMQIEVSP